MRIRKFSNVTQPTDTQYDQLLNAIKKHNELILEKIKRLMQEISKQEQQEIITRLTSSEEQDKLKNKLKKSKSSTGYEFENLRRSTKLQQIINEGEALKPAEVGKLITSLTSLSQQLEKPKKKFQSMMIDLNQILIPTFNIKDKKIQSSVNDILVQVNEFAPSFVRYQFAKELVAYIKTRTGEAGDHNLENHFFHWYGKYTAQDKIDAAKKVLYSLGYGYDNKFEVMPLGEQRTVEFTGKDLGALSDHRLGGIMQKYGNINPNLLPTPQPTHRKQSSAG